jgi:hypothetical protein
LEILNDRRKKKKTSLDKPGNRSIIGVSIQLLKTLERVPEIGDPAPESPPENINVFITICDNCAYASSNRKDDTRGAEIEKVLGEAGR